MDDNFLSSVRFMQDGKWVGKKLFWLLKSQHWNLNNTYLQPEPHYQNQALPDTLGLPQHTEHLYETIKQRTTVISDPPLAQSSELSLTEMTGSEEAMSLYRKWRSRVCAVM